MAFSKSKRALESELANYSRLQKVSTTNSVKKT